MEEVLSGWPSNLYNFVITRGPRWGWDTLLDIVVSNTIADLCVCTATRVLYKDHESHHTAKVQQLLRILIRRADEQSMCCLLYTSAATCPSL